MTSLPLKGPQTRPAPGWGWLVVYDDDDDDDDDDDNHDVLS